MTVDTNSTDATPTQTVSPWLGSMIALSGMLVVTLVAFVMWIMLKGYVNLIGLHIPNACLFRPVSVFHRPWVFGSNATKIVSISQATMVSYKSSEC